MQVYLGFRQVNPNTYGDHRQSKSQGTVSLTLLFGCKQSKQFLIHSTCKQNDGLNQLIFQTFIWV